MSSTISQPLSAYGSSSRLRFHTIETNVHDTDVVLRHARDRGTQVVVASTSEVYGKQAHLPVP